MTAVLCSKFKKLNFIILYKEENRLLQGYVNIKFFVSVNQIQKIKKKKAV